MTHAPPILTTTRLELRSFRLDDAELMLAVWNTPEFLRFVADRGIRTEAAARDALVAGPIATWQEFGYGPFRVGLIDGPGIGICGLFRRAELAVPDLGVALLPEYYGQGYGGEAAGAVLRYCDEVLALPRVQAIVAPDNVASCAMLRRLDFISDGDIEIGDASIKLFSRTRPEVPAMN